MIVNLDELELKQAVKKYVEEKYKVYLQSQNIEFTVRSFIKLRLVAVCKDVEEIKPNEGSTAP